MKQPKKNYAAVSCIALGMIGLALCCVSYQWMWGCLI